MEVTSTSYAQLLEELEDAKVAYRQMQETLRQQTTYQSALYQTALALMNRLEVTTLLEMIVTQAAALVGTAHGYIYLVDTATDELVLRVGIGIHRQYVGYRTKLDEGLVGRVWRSRQPLAVEDYQTWVGKSEQYSQGEFRAAIGLPLISLSEVVGIFGLSYLEEGQTFGEDTITLLQQFTQLASLALENARLYSAAQQELNERKRVEEQVRSLNTSLEERVNERTAQLEVAHKQVTTILESMTDAFLALDKHWQFAFVNPQAEQFLQKKRHVLLGRNIWEEFPDLAHSSFFQHCQTAYLQQVSVSFEAFYPSLQSWLEVKINPAQGGLALYICDITKRKEAEEVSQARARQQAAVADLGRRALEGFALPGLLEEATTIVIHTLAVEYSTIFEYFPDRTVLLARAGAGWPEGSIDSLSVSANSDSQAGYTLLTKEPVIVSDAHAETRFKMAPFLLELGITSSLSVIIAGQDRPFGVLSAHTIKQRPFTQDDVHFLQAIANVLATTIEQNRVEQERQAVQEALRESETRARHLVESNIIGVIVAESSGYISEANDAFLQMVGYTREDLQAGKLHWREMTPPEYVAAEKRANEEIRVKGVCTPYEKEYFRKDGSRIPILIGTAALDASLARGICFVLDLTERKRAESEQRFLAEASALLSSSIDYETTLVSLARLIVPQLADYCTIDLVREDLSQDKVMVAHIDSAKEEKLRQIRQLYPLDPHGTHPIIQVLKTSQAMLISDIAEPLLGTGAHDTELYQIHRELGSSSFIIAPLLARGRTLGTISLVTAESGRQYSSSDLALAQELAHRAGMAVDNARLYWESQEALGRISRLQAITAALSEALTPMQVATVILEQGVPALEARTGTVALLTDEDSFETIAAIGYPPEALAIIRRFPITMDSPISEATLTREPVLLESRAARLARYPNFTAVQTSTDTQALAALPLLIEGQPIGGLSLGFPTKRQFNDEDRAFLTALAQHCAQALERARLYEAEQQARAQAQAAIAAQQELDRLKDQFLAIASHELRTPLTAIKGYAQILHRNMRKRQTTSAAPFNGASETSPGAADREVRMLESIIKKINQMNELIGEMLDVSRIQTGRLELKGTLDINLVDLVRGVVEQQSSASDTHSLLFEVGEDNLPACCDALRVEQVVNNLINNAFKYSPVGTSVRVGVESRHKRAEETTPDGPLTQEKEAIIWVEDKGSGISLQEQKHIFERFYRIRSSDHAHIDGLGLGLYISSEIVKQHGGRMWLKSKPGTGSTFYFSLPLSS